MVSERPPYITSHKFVVDYVHSTDRANVVLKGMNDSSSTMAFDMVNVMTLQIKSLEFISLFNADQDDWKMKVAEVLSRSPTSEPRL